MLLATVLSRVTQLWAKGPLAPLALDCVQTAFVVLSNLLQKTLMEQDQATGSWNKSTEVTAYSVLTLAAASNTPVGAVVGEKLRTSIIYGRAFLEANFQLWGHDRPLWIEKVLYSSPILSTGFCTAALLTPTFTMQVASSEDRVATRVPSDSLLHFRKFYSRLPLLSAEPQWRLASSLYEAGLWYHRLADQRHEIFPRDNMAPDKYLQYIPQTWTLCNARNGNALEPDLMWNMMIISMLNYQVDEFLESVVGAYTAEEVNVVRNIIHRLCHDEQHHRESPLPTLLGEDPSSDEENSDIHPRRSEPTPPDSPKAGNANHTLAHTGHILYKFTRYILSHPAVAHSPVNTRRLLARELEIFLQAHLTDLVTSQQLHQSLPYLHLPDQLAKPPSSYFTWVRTTSADHTSCPYSFHFFAALVAYYHRPPDTSAPQSAFYGPRQRYLAESLCRHLATMCRQYNDYGSVSRDMMERNLNSVNFPEFWEQVGDGKIAGTHNDGGDHGKPTDKSLDAVKSDLIWLAEYERACCMGALDRLVNETGLPTRTARILQTFVDVTDLYGQIYVARDIASRVR